MMKLLDKMADSISQKTFNRIMTALLIIGLSTLILLVGGMEYNSLYQK
jgi:hypothetical protein